MNISFSGEMEIWMREQVASGEFESVSELARLALWEFRNRKIERVLHTDAEIIIRIAQEMEMPEIRTVDDLQREIRKGIEEEATIEWTREEKEAIRRESIAIQRLKKALNCATTSD